MAKYRHLSIDERKTIEEYLNKGTSFKQIALRLSRDKNTIAREVLRNSKATQSGAFGASFNNCLNTSTCNQYRLCLKDDCNRQTCCGCKFCFRLCPDFQREYCDKLELPPYTCNGCEKRRKCTLEKFIYRAISAHNAYREQATLAREGLATSPSEIERINKIISPLLKQGQSVGNILMSHKDEIMLDEKTLYKYIKFGLFDAKVIDLLNVVKMKPRRKKTSIKIDKKCREGRTYRDFLAFMNENPDTAVVQMDTVEGTKGQGEAVLLTIHFTEPQLMLAFKRDANTSMSVIKIINNLNKLLGDDVFKKLFPVILVDNGSEFSNPAAIEMGFDGEKRTRVFFADPSAPYQKGACENNHSLIRRIIPKGKSLNPYSKHDIDMIMNHVNSYKRKKLNGKCPITAFNFFHNSLILKKLGLKLIHHDEVILNPSLLKK